MSKKNIIIFCFIFNLSFISSKDEYINRHNNYNDFFDCSEKARKNKDKIITADDCFKKSPRTKWKCCYFEYINETDDDTIPEKGCMRVRKNNITDLNDLKYFVSKLSSQTVFNCKQNYINSSFGILLALLFFLI